MIISKSNYLNGSNFIYNPEFSIVPASPGQDISVIGNDDFSSVFTTSEYNNTITIEFDVPRDIGYIAICGSNITEQTGLTIVADGVTTIFAEPFSLNESKTIMIKPDITATTIDLIIQGHKDLAVANVAMGEYYTVPRGEQAGYKRPWSITNIKNRNASNLQNAPISMTHESRALSCVLSVPNNLMSDFSEWYEMIEFVTQNNFYILEDDEFDHSYACFNAMPDMTQAHGQTRKLGVSTLKFNAYSKTNEAFL